MTITSFAGVLALGLAAATVPGTRAVPKLKIPGFPGGGGGGGKKNNGAISQGTNTTETTTYTNSATCSGEVGVGTWAQATSEYLNLAKDDVVLAGCQGDIKLMVEKMEGKARAYAKTAIATKVKCEVEGPGAEGCAFAEGSAMAHATAVYDAWVSAIASADNSECGCAVKAISVVYSSVEKWRQLFATAMGRVESEACQVGTGVTSIEAQEICYANAVAVLTAEAAAGAWLKTEVNGAKVEGSCGPEDMVVTCDPGVNEAECKEEAYAKAKTTARAMLEVDETTKDDCTFKHSVNIDENGGSGSTEDGGSTDVSEEEDFKAKVKCVAEARTTATATAINTFVDTAIYATQENCKTGVDKYNDIGDGVGEAFAKAWIDTKAECNVEDGGSDAGVGCAYVQAFTAAFAKGAVDSWAIASSAGAFEDCKCKVEGEANAHVQAAFQADLFAKVIATAGVDLWGPEAENCVYDGFVEANTQYQCTASVMAAFWNKVLVEARLKGQCLLKDKAVCEHAKGPVEEEKCFEDNKLRVSVVADAIVNSEVTLKPGFCSGTSLGGFYYYDELKAGYDCKIGCA